MKKERGGAYGKNCPFLLPPVPFLDRNRGGAGRGGALGTALPGTAAAGERGKRERRPRGSDSPSQLEWRRPVKGGRQWPARGGDGGCSGGAGGPGRELAVASGVVVAEGCAEAYL